MGHMGGMIGVCRIAVCICAIFIILSPKHALTVLRFLPTITGLICGIVYAPKWFEAAQQIPIVGSKEYIGEELTMQWYCVLIIGAAVLAYIAGKTAQQYVVFLTVTYAGYVATGAGGGPGRRWVLVLLGGLLSRLLTPIFEWFWEKVAPVVLPIVGAGLFTVASLSFKSVCPVIAAVAKWRGSTQFDVCPHSEPLSLFSPCVVMFITLASVGLYRHLGFGLNFEDADEPAARVRAPSVALPVRYRGRSVEPHLTDEQLRLRSMLRDAYLEGRQARHRAAGGGD